MRDLSRLLILILLILAPVTYSNENIPNFQPDCVSGQPLAAKARYTVAVMRRIDAAAPVATYDADVASASSPCPPPHVSPVFSSTPSRAPPA